MVHLQSWLTDYHQWNSTQAPTHLSSRSIGLPLLGDSQQQSQINTSSKINFAEPPTFQSKSAYLDDRHSLVPGSPTEVFRQGEGRLGRTENSPNQLSPISPSTKLKERQKGDQFRRYAELSRGIANEKNPPSLNKQQSRKGPHDEAGNLKQTSWLEKRVGGSETRPLDRSTSVGVVEKVSKLFPLFKKQPFSKKKQPFSQKKMYKGKGETIWLNSQVKAPRPSSSSHGQGPYKRSDRIGSSSSSSAYPSGKHADAKKKRKEVNCSIGRREKGDDAALITLGAIGIPLAIAGVLLSGPASGAPLTNSVTAIFTGLQSVLTPVIAALQAVVTAIATAIGNVITAIANFIQGLIPGRSSTFGEPLDRSDLTLLPWILRKTLTFNSSSFDEVQRSLQSSLSIFPLKVATPRTSDLTHECFPSQTKDLNFSGFETTIHGIQNFIDAVTVNARTQLEFRDSLILWFPMMWPSILRKVLIFNWDAYNEIWRSMQDTLSVVMWRVASTAGASEQADECFVQEMKDLGSDMEFIDENEIVLRMLDDLMMTYKYGYVPKCTRSHICKLNKAAASGGQPQSTIVPLMSLPAAWLLGKPSSNVMDFLHAVWLGRNEKDCDEVYPECSDIYSSLRFRGGGANSTDTELEADLHMDELLNDLRYLEENNQMAPAAETNQDRKEDDPKEEKTT